MKILVIHGPNLNLLGTRKPEVYGTQTLAEVNNTIANYAAEHDASITPYQSNHEGAIIDMIHELCGPRSDLQHDAIIINPGAYTHYSIAIRDAIEAVEVPAVEVHLSNIHDREAFRRESVIAPVCLGQIMGHGVQSYLMAIDRLLQ